MAVKKYKPVTPGTRGMTGYTFEEITKSTPERSLLVNKKNHGGRNAQGRVTVRHRGGGARRFVRIVDFKREKFGIPARVAAIEYDPNRTARLALLFYVDGEKRYIIAPLDLKVGDKVVSGPTAEIRPGNLRVVRVSSAGRSMAASNSTSVSNRNPASVTRRFSDCLLCFGPNANNGASASATAAVSQ